MRSAYSDIAFALLEVDTAHEIGAQYGVTSSPIFAFFMNRVKVEQVLGANKAALESLVLTAEAAQ